MAPAAVSGDGQAGVTDARRVQILRAALEVIAQRGFSDARVADVADRAEVSSGLVIYYFKTKDQLLTEAMRYTEDAWYEEGARRMQDTPSAAARLEQIVTMTFVSESPQSSRTGATTDDGPAEPWALWLDLWALSVRNDNVAAVREEFDEHWRETIRQIVRDGIDTGEFNVVDIDEFAIAFTALLDGLAIQVALRDSTVDEKTAVRVALRYAGERLGFEPGFRGRSRSRQRRAEIRAPSR
jgi:AcrR family transcriptional regulator